MNYRGPFGTPRLTGVSPLVEQEEVGDRIDMGEIKEEMEPVADDVSVTILSKGDMASVDYRLSLEPKRERKSSVTLLRENEVFETTLRFPIIDADALDKSEVLSKMDKVTTRSGTPSTSKVESPVRMYDMESRDRAHNPHVILKKPDGMNIRDYASWVERITRAFNDFFPRFMRVKGGG